MEGMTILKPFSVPGELKLIKSDDLKPTFGTGLHTVTPAHNILSLRQSYAHNLPRDGCVDPTTGTLTQPPQLINYDVSSPKLAEHLEATLKQTDQFFCRYKHTQNEFRTKLDDELIHLVTVDGWFVKISEKLKFNCFKELATVKFFPDLNLKSEE